ncbi:MAG TPA: hypothetical protein VD932_02685 [Aquabacterium sp.]|nr:hypothetical protein [Aquabacterium sp.]
MAECLFLTNEAKADLEAAGWTFTGPYATQEECIAQHQETGTGTSTGTGHVYVDVQCPGPQASSVEQVVFSQANGNAISISAPHVTTLVVDLVATGCFSVNLGSTTGISWTTGANGATVQQFRGSVSDVVNALAGLTVVFTLGTASLDITAADVENSSYAFDSCSVAITLVGTSTSSGSGSGSNTAPLITAPSCVTTATSTDLTSSFAVSVADDDAEVTVTLTRSVAVFSIEGGASASMTGTVAAVNSWLAGITIARIVSNTADLNIEVSDGRYTVTSTVPVYCVHQVALGEAFSQASLTHVFVELTGLTGGQSYFVELTDGPEHDSSSGFNVLRVYTDQCFTTLAGSAAGPGGCVGFTATGTSAWLRFDGGAGETYAFTSGTGGCQYGTGTGTATSTGSDLGCELAVEKTLSEAQAGIYGTGSSGKDDWYHVTGLDPSTQYSINLWILTNPGGASAYEALNCYTGCTSGGLGNGAALVNDHGGGTSLQITASMEDAQCAKIVQGVTELYLALLNPGAGVEYGISVNVGVCEQTGTGTGTTDDPVSCLDAAAMSVGTIQTGSITSSDRLWFRLTGLDAATQYSFNAWLNGAPAGTLSVTLYTTCGGGGVASGVGGVPQTLTADSTDFGQCSNIVVGLTEVYALVTYSGGDTATYELAAYAGLCTDTGTGTGTGSEEAGVSYLFQDEFTESDGTNLESGTPETGTWAVSQTAKFSITSNKVSQTADYAPDQVYAFVDGGVGTADHTIECEITLPNAAGNFPLFLIAIQGRNQAETGLNGWNYVLSEDGPSDTTLSRKGFAVNGATISQASSYSFTPGQTFTLKIVFSGNNITSYIDGVQDVTFTSSTHNTDVNVGFCMYRSAPYTAAATINYFRVYAS